MKLQDRVVIVTGAGMGIGKAIALEFGAEGANVVLAARSLDNLEAVAGEIRSAGGRATVMQTDITEEAQIQSLVSQTVEMHGRLDILVNNSAASSTAAWVNVVDMDVNEWNNVLNVNLTGTMLCCKAALAVMIEQKSGNIINIASVAGMSGMSARSAYACSKWGVIGLTETLAIEAGVHDIRVNSISPAATNTEKLHMGLRRRAEALGISYEEMMQRFLKHYSLKKIADTAEIGRVAVFLASEDASAITGQNLPVTCGFHILGPTEVS
ncbi:SDR family NAD(P)-dependent oxidoreductase [Chloroflexota bacterium]